jgi:hypothetical protein
LIFRFTGKYPAQFWRTKLPEVELEPLAALRAFIIRRPEAHVTIQGAGNALRPVPEKALVTGRDTSEGGKQ